MLINFVSWGYKNVISGKVDFVATESELCTSVGMVTLVFSHILLHINAMQRNVFYKQI